MGSGHLIDPDEVECMLANMIYKVSRQILRVDKALATSWHQLSLLV
jgi:hypothetical protein